MLFKNNLVFLRSVSFQTFECICHMNINAKYFPNRILWILWAICVCVWLVHFISLLFAFSILLSLFQFYLSFDKWSIISSLLLPTFHAFIKFSRICKRVHINFILLIHTGKSRENYFPSFSLSFSFSFSFSFSCVFASLFVALLL